MVRLHSPPLDGSRESAPLRFSRVKPLLLLLFVNLCAAQDLPEAPHKFFDRQNVVLFSMNAGLVTADAFTTNSIVNQHPNGREWNPIARPFVENTNPRRAVIFWAGTYAGSIGLSYLFHHTRHHRVERFTQYLLLGSEAYSVTSNVITVNRGGH